MRQERVQEAKCLVEWDKELGEFYSLHSMQGAHLNFEKRIGKYNDFGASFELYATTVEGQLATIHWPTLLYIISSSALLYWENWDV